MEWRKVDDETLIREFGPPLFVPIGRSLGKWRIHGIGRDPSAARTIHAGAPSLTGSIDVDTSTPRNKPAPLGWAVSNVISRAVPPDVTLPFTITADERVVDLAVDGRLVAFQVIEAGDYWQASAIISGRLVEVTAAGLEPEQIELHQVSDFLELTPERLPHPRPDPR